VRDNWVAFRMDGACGRVNFPLRFACWIYLLQDNPWVQKGTPWAGEWARGVVQMDKYKVLWDILIVCQIMIVFAWLLLLVVAQHLFSWDMIFSKSRICSDLAIGLHLFWIIIFNQNNNLKLKIMIMIWYNHDIILNY